MQNKRPMKIAIDNKQCDNLTDKNVKKLNVDSKKYFEEHPTDFLTNGMLKMGLPIDFFDDGGNGVISKEEGVCLGKVLYYESIDELEKALHYGKEGASIVANFYERNPEMKAGDYQKTFRIQVLNNKIKKKKVKELEVKAKEMEKEDIDEAIKLYDELNIINPNLKKYNKRLGVLKRRKYKEKK